MADLSVIIPAAGSGSRMGREVPKAYLSLGGMTILERTIRCFDRPDRVNLIIIAAAPDWLDHTRKLIDGLQIGVPVRVIEGGSERMYSILNALKVLPESARYVAVHDAARPFLSRVLFDSLIAASGIHKAVTPGVPVTDTVKVVDQDGNVVSTPDRKTLMAVQTPQIFERNLLEEAYAHAITSGYLGTDDASLVEHLGREVRLIPGELENFKITWPGDLETAEKILNKKNNS